MNALIDAISSSIVDEVSGASDWTVEKSDPIWRDPKAGKVLNVYLGPERPGDPRWTGGTIDIVEIIIEYAEPAPEQARDLARDETGEYAANEVARNIREWALAHPAGFAPAHQLDWTGTEYTPQVNRELFVRYCRVRVECKVEVVYS